MNIQSIEDVLQDDKFRIMVYGYSSVGKTQLISTIPADSGKICILNTDKGLKTLRKIVKEKQLKIDCEGVNTWKEVTDFLNYMKTDESKKKYDWIVFDSVSAMMDLLFIDLNENKKLAGFDLWREYGNFVMKFMRFVRDQQDYHTLSIFEAIDKEDDNGVVGKGFSIQGQTGNRVANFYDEVFALRVSKDGERVLQTSASPGWIAKDRSQTLEKNEKADLGIIMKKIIGG